jgi:hypothetical protein
MVIEVFFIILVREVRPIEICGAGVPWGVGADSPPPLAHQPHRDPLVLL